MPKHCDKESILANIRRVSGQVNGIEKMIVEDREITEVIQQLTAASSALKSVSRTLLEDYANGCFGSNKLGKEDLQKIINQLFKAL